MKSLFQEKDLSSYFDSLLRGAQKRIVDMSDEQFRTLDLEDFQQTLIQECTLQPISLGEMVLFQNGEVNVQVRDFGQYITTKGVSVSAHIPYTGSRVLFECRPNQYTLVRMEAFVNKDEIVITKDFRQSEIEKIPSIFESCVNDIQFHVGSIKRMLEEYNPRVAGVITSSIHSRKSRLDSNTEKLSALGIRIRRSSPEVIEYQIPTQRRQSPAKTVKASPVNPDPNYSLEQQEYNYILDVLRNMTLVMERTPKVFREFDEESIRDIFLVILNGHYEGNATGETFNNQGKSDILIRHEGRNAFIAECKFWHGEKGFIETIDQLTQRYLTWRDTKAAVLIFNRNKNFTSVVKQIPDLCRKHPCYVKDGSHAKNEAEFHFIAKHKDDEKRLINIAVMSFDIPT